MVPEKLIWIQFADYEIREGEPCPRCGGRRIYRLHAGFGRCPQCEADNSRYAQLCTNCQGPLTGDDVRAWNEKLWADRQAQLAGEHTAREQTQRELLQQNRLLGAALAREVGERERARLSWWWSNGGLPDAFCAICVEPRLKNCPNPVRMAVLPLPNTSQASPNRKAGRTDCTCHSVSGRLGLLAVAISMPLAGFGAVE